MSDKSGAKIQALRKGQDNLSQDNLLMFDYTR